MPPSLRTFGGLSLDGVAGPVQRKRLLLLAVLAAAGPSGLGRDAVLALFWGESAEADARNSLKQALFAIRRAVGDSAVVADAAMLRLDPAAMSSDVAAFAAALARHDDAAAVAAYRGPFLDGVPLPVGPDGDALERWVAERRLALGGPYRDALRRLADGAAVLGDWSAAVAWSERLTAADPLDRTATLQLVQALAEAGEVPRARRRAHLYEQLVRAELGTGPGAEFAVCVARLTAPRASSTVDLHATRSVVRSERVREAAAPQPVPPLATTEASDATTGGSSGESPQTADPSNRDAGVPPRGPARRRRLGPLAAVLVGVPALLTLLRLGVLAFGVTWRKTSTVKVNADAALSRAARPGGRRAIARVLVTPFRTDAADPVLTFLGSGTPVLLAGALSGGGGLEAVDPAQAAAWRGGLPAAGEAAVVRADAGLGIAYVVVGAVTGTAARAVVTAQLLAVSDSRVVATARAMGPADRAAALTDRLAAQLLAGAAPAAAREGLGPAVSGAAADGSGIAGASSVPALPAVRAYIDGWAAYHAGDYAGATRAFLAAVNADSDFAAAGVGLAMSAGYISALDARGRGLAIAWHGRTRLSGRDRAYLSAALGPRYPGPSSWDESMQATERALQVYPANAELWYEFGDGLYHQGPAHDLPAAAVRAAAAFDQATRLDPAYAAPIAHLVELAARDGDTAAVRRLAARYAGLDSTGEVAQYLRWRVAHALRDRAALAAWHASALEAPDAVLQRVMGMARLDAVGLDDADRAAVELSRRALRSVAPGRALLALHAYALDRGRAGEARALVAEAGRAGALSPTEVRVQLVADALFGGGDAVAGAEAYAALADAFARDLARAPSSRDPADVQRRALTACAVGLWRAARGEANIAEPRRALATVAALPTPPDLERALHGRATARLCGAMVAAAAGGGAGITPSTAIARLDSLSLHGAGPGAPGVISHAANLVLARALAAEGEPARAAVAARRRGYFWDVGWYLSEYLREEARAAARAGDERAAQRADAHLRALQPSRR